MTPIPNALLTLIIHPIPLEVFIQQGKRQKHILTLYFADPHPLFLTSLKNQSHEEIQLDEDETEPVHTDEEADQQEEDHQNVQETTTILNVMKKNFKPLIK